MVKSVKRAADIFKLISRHQEGLTYVQISYRLKYPHGSLWALLTSLVELELLTFESLTKRYSLGPQFLMLAGRYLSNLDIVQIGRPFIKKAVELTDESSLLVVPYGSEALFVHRENCQSNSIMSTARVGQRSPLYATPSGKILLAFSSDDDIDWYLSTVNLEPITSHTKTDPDSLRAELQDIRRSGIAYSREEYREQMTAIGMPVFDHLGNVVAAIDIAAPSYRCDLEKEEYIKSVLRLVSGEMSHALGAMASGHVNSTLAE